MKETCAIVSTMHACIMYVHAKYDMVTNTATLHMAW